MRLMREEMGGRKEEREEKRDREEGKGGRRD